MATDCGMAICRCGMRGLAGRTLRLSVTVLLVDVLIGNRVIVGKCPFVISIVGSSMLESPVSSIVLSN